MGRQHCGRLNSKHNFWKCLSLSKIINNNYKIVEIIVGTKIFFSSEKT